MSILIFAIVVIIIAALLIYAVDLVPGVGSLANLIKLLIIVVVALIIAQRAGVV